RAWVQEFERRNVDVGKAGIAKYARNVPARERVLVWRVAYHPFNKRNILLQKDLRVHHVGLRESQHAARLEKLEIIFNGHIPVEMMQDSDAEYRVKTLIRKLRRMCVHYVILCARRALLGNIDKLG